MQPEHPELDLSVVAPAHNEEGNIRPLVEQIRAALDPQDEVYEILIVNDGSTDGTMSVLEELLAQHDVLRVISMERTPAGRGHGQSAAFHAGFRAARGQWIAVLDADLQNDPADLPAMLQRLREADADFVQGDRSQNRRDSFGRHVGMWVGRAFRRVLLGDRIRDTGCSLRVMRREIALALPLQFRGMHRYIPATARQMGYRVVETPVNHRPRISGETKYNNWQRGFVGLFDCLAVRWMRNRRRPVAYKEIPRPTEGAGSDEAPVEARPAAV